MQRSIVFVLVAASLGVAVLLLVTSGALPERVASHFGPGGKADGWMSRNGYLMFMLAFGVVLPWLMFVLAQRRAGSASPGGDERPSVRTFAAATALLVTLLVGTMHFLVIDANSRTPATLAEQPFYIVLGVFAVAMAGLAIGFARRSRASGAAAPR